MLKHRGTITLYTDRLLLRRFTPEDATDMFANWANDPDVTRYLSWLPHQDIEVTKKILSSWLSLYERPNYYNWAIVPKRNGKVIGSISVVETSEKTSGVRDRLLPLQTLLESGDHDRSFKGGNRIFD